MKDRSLAAPIIASTPSRVRRSLLNQSSFEFVSLHRYLKVHPGKLDAIKAMLPKVTAKTADQIDTSLQITFWERHARV